MKVTFDKLIAQNFRQIADREFDFRDGLNLIVGANGSGKTNLLHAITWCLFGKDMDDRTKFEVVPLNPDNTRTELEPDVTLAISIDGEKHELRRQLKGGKTAQTYINGAPCKTLKEFDSFVADIFSTPERFKMYANPLFFPEMHWKEQREIFMQFFPMPKSSDVLKYMAKRSGGECSVAKELEKLEPERLIDKFWQERKDLEVERDKIRAQIELLDDQLEGYQQFDADKLQKERESLRDRLANIQDNIKAISDSNAKIEARRQQLESFIRKQESDIERLKDEAKYGKERKLRELKDELEVLERMRQKLANEFRSLKSDGTTCPTCGQELPAIIIEEQENVLQSKRAEIAQEGTKIAGRIKALRENIEITKSEAVVDFDVGEQVNAINKAKSELVRLEPPTVLPSIKDSDLIRLDELDKALSRGDVHAENIERRNKLMDREREINKLYEKAEVAARELADFMFYRAEMIVNAVNKSFKKISVKVLEIQKNGEAKETFEILKNGVPYSELNTAGKLEAGLELTGFLKDQLHIDCPTLIDNGERYTDVNLSQIKGQIIIATAREGAELQVLED
jgi:DNA repair exonuclease SbcCD ATPase subunit